MKYSIVFDGGALRPGKQHPACYGSFIVSVIGAHGHAFKCSPVRVQYPELKTANQAEFRTAVDALKWIRQHSTIPAAESDIEMTGDSQLAVFCLAERWKLKNPELKAIRAEFLCEADHFGSVNLDWHPRAKSVAVLGH